MTLTHAPVFSGTPASCLRCRNCGAEYPLAAIHACAECFGPLEVGYDDAALAAVTRDHIERGPKNLWRYAGLLPVGAPRRDWRATLISDGTVVVRHPELQPLIEMTERFATDLQLYAG